MTQGNRPLGSLAEVRSKMGFSLNAMQEQIGRAPLLNKEGRLEVPIAPGRACLLTLANDTPGRYNPHNFEAINTVPEAVKFNLVLSIIL
jgi:hypothetical protein